MPWHDALLVWQPVWHDKKLAEVLVFGEFVVALPALDEFDALLPILDERVAPREPGEFVATPGVAAAPAPAAFAEFAVPPLCGRGGGVVISAIASQKQAMLTPDQEDHD